MLGGVCGACDHRTSGPVLSPARAQMCIDRKIRVRFGIGSHDSMQKAIADVLVCEEIGDGQCHSKWDQTMATHKSLACTCNSRGVAIQSRLFVELFMDQRRVKSTRRPTKAEDTTGSAANMSAAKQSAHGQMRRVEVMPRERSIGEPSTFKRDAARPAVAYSWPVRLTLVT
eukprot:scaffold5440_cov32-Tisochrysis_lutea.AAC.4